MAAAFPPGTVLVLKPSSLGDVVHTLPAVARLRAVRPDWRVAWLVNPEWAPLLRGNPLGIEAIVEFPRREFRGLAGWGRLGRWLRTEIVGRQPELALDFQGLLRTALLGRLAGARRLLGLSDAREGATLFYHRTTPAPPGPVHAVHRYLALVDDVLGGEGRELPITFPLPPPGEPWAEPSPSGGSGFIVLHPFARGAGKSLTGGQVRALCEGLSPRPILVVGRGGEEIGDLPDHARNLLGRTTLNQLLDLLRRAAFVLSVDSGPMHLAAAALAEPRRLLSLHAWSDPRRVGPFPAAAFVWQSGRLRRVGELSAGEPPPVPGPLLPGTADVRAVCAHVIRESEL